MEVLPARNFLEIHEPASAVPWSVNYVLIVTSYIQSREKFVRNALLIKKYYKYIKVNLVAFKRHLKINENTLCN